MMWSDCLVNMEPVKGVGVCTSSKGRNVKRGGANRLLFDLKPVGISIGSCVYA